MDLFTKYGIYASQLRGAYYKLLDETTLTSAQTFYDLDFSDYDKSKIYQLITDQEFSSGGSTYAYIDDDKTNANYTTQLLNADGTSDNASRPSVPYVNYAESGNRSYSSTLFKWTNSSNILWLSSINQDYDTSSIELLNYGGKKNDTVSDWSKLTVQSSVTSGLPIGTKIALYEITPASELVEEVIVSTDTDTVDFTSLAYGKTDDLYMELDLVNGSTSTSNYYVYTNNDQVASNYYVQRLIASSTTVSGSRLTDSKVTELGGSFYGYGICNIKLANNGTFVTHTESLSNLPSLYKYVTSKNATITSIDRLTLKSSISDGIGAGSVIRLYRRKTETIVDEVQPTDDTYMDIDLTDNPIEIGDICTLRLTVNNYNTSTTSYYFYINENYTASNYYTQRILADGTSVTAVRYNNSTMGITDSGDNSYIDVSFMLSENGQLVRHSNNLEHIGASDLKLYESCGKSNFENENISSIRIQGRVGADSRVQIVKWTK